MKKIKLCTWCIDGIRSHGETVYVGDEIEYDDEHDEEVQCDFCGETEERIFCCVIE